MFAFTDGTAVCVIFPCIKMLTALIFLFAINSLTR